MKRAEIEDVLAILSDDIENMEAGRPKRLPTAPRYARALRHYLQRGRHHGAAARREKREESSR
jgi:hypothetical protein